MAAPASKLHPGRQTVRAATLSLCAMMLSGCQSLSSPGAYARVRIVDLSADTAAVDIYHGSNAVAYNLTFGTVTSYVPVTPGNSTLTVNNSGSRQVLSAFKGTFNAGTQYTMLVHGAFAGSQQTILTDTPQQSGPGTSSGASVRLIHQAAHAGPVDVYLVPDGQRLNATTPIASNLAPGAATGYLPLATGIVAVVMLPAGAPASASYAIHSGRQLRYSNGVARTIILVDAQPSASSDVQVITTTDTDTAP